MILDTGLFTGHQRMSDAWLAFRDFTARTEDLPIGMLVRGGCHSDPGDEVIAAYEAPYPDAASKAGARAFPTLVPMTPDAPGAAAGRDVLQALTRGPPPDPDAVGRLRPRAAARPWASASPPPSASRRHALIEGAGHFLQEDRGPLLGALIAEWLAAEPREEAAAGGLALRTAQQVSVSKATGTTHAYGAVA